MKVAEIYKISTAVATMTILGIHITITILSLGILSWTIFNYSYQTYIPSISEFSVSMKHIVAILLALNRNLTAKILLILLLFWFERKDYSSSYQFFNRHIMYYKFNPFGQSNVHDWSWGLNQGYEDEIVKLTSQISSRLRFCFTTFEDADNHGVCNIL